jgi:hypothetical protein
MHIEALLCLLCCCLGMSDNWVCIISEYTAVYMTEFEQIRNIAQYGTLPAKRDSFAETYNPASNSIIVAGGWNSAGTAVTNGDVFCTHQAYGAY